MGQQPYILWGFWSCVFVALVLVSLITYLAKRGKSAPAMKQDHDILEGGDPFAKIERDAELVGAYYRLLVRERVPKDLVYRLVESYAFQLAFVA